VERWWVERVVAAMMVVALLAAGLLCAVVIGRVLNPPPVRVCLPVPAGAYECAATGDDGPGAGPQPPDRSVTAQAPGLRRVAGQGLPVAVVPVGLG
jgi:hypothetical protein